jgi:hypothetical protein
MLAEDHHDALARCVLYATPTPRTSRGTLRRFAMKMKTVLLALAATAMCGALLSTCTTLPPLPIPIPVAQAPAAPAATVQLPG